MADSKRIRTKIERSCDMIDITSQVAEEIDDSGISSGILTVFAAGSTAGICTIERQSGLLSDFKSLCDRLIPASISHKHDRAWSDGIGQSPMWAPVLCPSLSVPFLPTAEWLWGTASES